MNDRVAIEAALRKGVFALARAQEGGAFEGEMRWCPMLAAQYVLFHHLLDRPIPAPRRQRLLRYFERARVPDGSWGLHDHAAPSLYVTVLVYVASRLLGAPADAPYLAEARALFESEKVERVPTWGRVWLAMLGLYGWEGVIPMPPEVWALPEALPIHPSRYYCHTRLIYLGLSLLRTEAKTKAPDQTLLAVRRELYPARAFVEIDFRAFRFDVSGLDLVAPIPRPMRGALGVIGVAEAFIPGPIRRSVAGTLREAIRFELRTTDHLGVSPVSGMLCALALAAHDPNDETVARTIASLETWVFEDDVEGCRVTGARSQTWDTAFALQALVAASPVATEGPALRLGASYLAAQQIPHAFRDFARFHRIDPSGGFCFAHREHGWPVSDCTAEALIALIEIEDPAVPLETLHQGVRFILRCQNEDGAFGSYEPKRVRGSLEALNPSEMFLECMTEGSYVECTASCLMALVDWRARFGDHALVPRVSEAIDRARAFLVASQRPDGSFDAAWGIHYVYGTMFGLRALRKAGALPTDACVRRAVRFLIRHQRPDGGFGEHESSALENRYVDLGESHPVQTAWALLALTESGAVDAHDAARRAAAYLARAVRDDGTWESPRMVGCFFRTALVDYTLYRTYFPVWALGSYLGAQVAVAPTKQSRTKRRRALVPEPVA